MQARSPNSNPNSTQVRIRNDTIVQLGIAMIFTMFFMLASSIASPYRRKENDYFAVTCNFSPTAYTPYLATHPCYTPLGDLQLLAHRGLPLVRDAQGPYTASAPMHPASAPTHPASAPPMHPASAPMLPASAPDAMILG